MPFVAASRTYVPGQLIYCEDAFVHVLPRVMKDEFCESCRCGSNDLRSCKQCMAVKYCGKSCQKKDWRNHRVECKQMGNLDDSNCSNLVRLLGRVILKIKGKDWKNFKRSVLGTDVSFEDIDSHYTEMIKETQLNLMCKELKEGTKKFIGVENMPSDTDFVRITGKVFFNTILNAENDLPGLCFFIGMSMFEHECIPNSSFAVRKNALRVWASKRITKGSEKITVSYRTLFGASSHICVDQSEEIDSKNCKCSDCSLPYGESVLSKILDETRAFTVIKLTRNILNMTELLTVFDLEHHADEVADEVLKKHSGILGRTNILHLKLLRFRCLDIGGHPWEVKEGLMELESIIKSVFGEFYIEMLPIYRALGFASLRLGNFSDGKAYLLKMEKLERLLE